MEIGNVIKLLHAYEICPRCGSKLIGNGEGTLEIAEDTFRRTCKCGFKIKVGEENR